MKRRLVGHYCWPLITLKLNCLCVRVCTHLSLLERWQRQQKGFCRTFLKSLEIKVSWVLWPLISSTTRITFKLQTTNYKVPRKFTKSTRWREILPAVRAFTMPARLALKSLNNSFRIAQDALTFSSLTSHYKQFARKMGEMNYGSAFSLSKEKYGLPCIESWKERGGTVLGFLFWIGAFAFSGY